MRLVITLLICLALAALVYFVLDFSALNAWAIDAQRGFQNRMAAAVRGLKAGEAGAYIALLSATGAYGFVHAVGPGHGKFLVGGVGLGSNVSTARLLGLAISSSIAQALWAIILVYGGFFLLEVTAHQLTDLAEDILAPASYLIIAGVGATLLWRGLKVLRSRSKHHEHTHSHAHADCGCHSHGPTPQEAAKVHSLRDAVTLVLSIAIRPCTGAIFLLVIAWQMDIKMAGIAAVIVMGLGTAALTSLVAISTTFARQATVFATSTAGNFELVMPSLQIFAGTMIILISLGFLGLLA